MLMRFHASGMEVGAGAIISVGIGISVDGTVLVGWTITVGLTGSSLVNKPLTFGASITPNTMIATTPTVPN